MIIVIDYITHHRTNIANAKLRHFQNLLTQLKKEQKQRKIIFIFSKLKISNC